MGGAAVGIVPVRHVPGRRRRDLRRAAHVPARPGPLLLASAGLRSAAIGDRQLRWPALPATAAELSEAIGAGHARDVHCVRLSQAQAATDRVVAELPCAWWAHFATHGFFADKKFRSAFQLPEGASRARRSRRRPAQHGRRPQPAGPRASSWPGRICRGRRMSLAFPGRRRHPHGRGHCHLAPGSPGIGGALRLRDGSGRRGRGRGRFRAATRLPHRRARYVVASLWKLTTRPRRC